jgi:hypothetical protein
MPIKNMKYTQKSGYAGIRSYLTSIVGSAAVGAAVLFGGLEARAQDPLKFLTKTVLIDKSPLPKDQKDLLHIDNMLDVQREGTAKYEAEQKHKESVENQEKIIKLLEEQKASGTSTNGTNYVMSTVSGGYTGENKTKVDLSKVDWSKSLLKEDQDKAESNKHAVDLSKVDWSKSLLKEEKDPNKEHRLLSRTVDSVGDTIEEYVDCRIVRTKDGRVGIHYK